MVFHFEAELRNRKWVALWDGLMAQGMTIKSPLPALHKTTRSGIASLLGEAKPVLGRTPKAISPFAGLASCISLLGWIGFWL